MAFIIHDLSDEQIFEYKGYSVHMWCSKYFFWSRKRIYTIHITISDNTYQAVAQQIQVIRQQNEKAPRNALEVLARIQHPQRNIQDIILTLKQYVKFCTLIDIKVDRQFSILDKNEPYVQNAISKIKQIIDDQYNDLNERFNTFVSIWV